MRSDETEPSRRKRAATVVTCPDDRGAHDTGAGVGEPTVEHPEADERHIKRVVVRHGLQPVSKAARAH